MMASQDAQVDGPTQKTPEEVLALPPPAEASATTSTPSISPGGTFKMDHLGPMIINSDGTVSRIANWAALSPQEQATALRRLAKRNNERRQELESKSPST